MHFHRASRFFLLVLPVFFLTILAGCGEEPVETDPPEGWQADGDHWWTPEADTASAFRDLSSLEAMGVVGPRVLSATGTPSDEQVMRRTKSELERLYRKDPETIDSLFARYIAPKVADVPRSGDMSEQISAFGEESHDTIREHFYPATQLTMLGQDVPLGYPDSLFEQGVGGRVRMQVRVDADGQPQAIKLIEGVHPVLDATARRAVAQAKWEPARVRQGDYGWREIPSWTWVTVNFG